MAELIEEATQFGTGFGKGIRDFGKETVQGVADLGQAGYSLATDPAYREQAFETAKEISKQVGEGIGQAVDDPAGALAGIKNRASGAWDAYQTERAQAAAEGRLAEFDGQMAGRGLAEIGSVFMPVSKLGKLGKAGDVLAGAGKLEKVAAAASAEKRAAQAIQVGQALPKQAPSSKVLCPLGKPDKPAAKKTSAKTGQSAAGKPTLKNVDTCTSGCPISMATGEELLELTDFTWDGPLSLPWTRFYRSGQSALDLQLGHGWLTPLDEWLDISDTAVSFHDREGRTIELPLPEPGDYSLNLPEQLRLYREAGHFRLVSENQPDRIFQGEYGRCRLRRWQNGAGFIELVYDPRNQVQALKASWGKTLLIQRDGMHIAAIGPAKLGEQGLALASAPFVRYQYNEQGDLIGALDPLDHGETYAYRQHMITRRTLATGFNFHFEWDDYSPSGRCLRNYGDNGIYDYRFEWTDSGLSRAIDSRGGVTEYMHDANALLLWQTSPAGRSTHYAYNEHNLLSRVTDAAGHSTTYAYDEGRLIAVTDPLGHTAQLAYNETGQLTGLTDPLGQTWNRGYDGQGRLTQTQDPQGGVTRITYNDQGLPAKIVNALGQTRTLLWDDQARLVGEIGFDGSRRHYRYDGEDRIIAASQNQRISQYQYDAAGRVIAIKSPDGSVVKLDYNEAGLLARYTDAAGRATEYRYGDGLSQLTERIDPAGQVLRYHYDSERNLTGLTNAKGEHYQLNYDKDEHLIEEIGFDGRVQRYHYDATGQLDLYAQRGEQAWQVTRFQRDPLGRLLKKTGGDGAVSEFAYDPLGRLSRARNSHAQLKFQYNPLGQVISESQNDATVTHEYDTLGQRTATVTPTGQRIDYAYNAQGRLHTVSLDGEILSRHQFDEQGLETARQQGQLVSRYAYDPQGRLTQHQAGLRDKAAVLGRRYGYDAAGRLNAVDDLRQGLSRYLYDPADRLIEVEGLTPERFVHDPAGNLIGVNNDGGLVKGDRLLLLGDRHFSYDAAGNLVEERRGKEGRLITRYAYDSDNRLIRAETPQGTSQYRYDPLGRRIAKQTPDGETRFVYDGAKLLQETRAERQRTYLFEPGGFRPLACIDRVSGAKSQVYYYHLDHLGTPRELTDAAGKIVWSARYRAYGALALADVAEIDNPLRFQGQYYDAETGLHYNLNRYYDPQAGQFIHQDPIGLLGGLNPYQYVPNPTGWVDPFGLTAQKENKNRQTNSIAASKPDFYVGPSGPNSTLPSTAFRYDRYLNDDGTPNKWGQQMLATNEGRVTYFGFEKYETGSQAADAFQIKTIQHVNPLNPADTSWSDARLRGQFDTLQLYENGLPTARVPRAFGDQIDAPPEPFTSAYPEYGGGGAQQLHAGGKTIKFDKVDILPDE
jgi:RHS repeat-associated protein